MAIRCHERINLVEQPGSARDLPWQDRPLSLTANGQREGDRSRPAYFDPSVGDGPRCSVAFGPSDANRLALGQPLRRDNFEPFVCVEAPHPAGTTGTKTSITVENKRGTLRPLIRKTTEGNDAHHVSMPVPD
ncbi:MAG: hypothetical protein ACI8RE_000962 [Ilumatobacter sp.]|jgi:hypothetical protein